MSNSDINNVDLLKGLVLKNGLRTTVDELAEAVRQLGYTEGIRVYLDQGDDPHDEVNYQDLLVAAQTLEETELF